MNTQVEGQQESRFKQGIFLELYNSEGVLATPLWISLRDKPVLTKQITQATAFEGMDAALFILAQLDVEGICQGKGAYLSPSARTFDAHAHKVFWDRMNRGTAKVVNEDYSLHMIKVRQLIDQLDHALLNGPVELAKTLPRELFNAFLDLSTAIDRHLNP